MLGVRVQILQISVKRSFSFFFCIRFMVLFVCRLVVVCVDVSNVYVAVQRVLAGSATVVNRKVVRLL